jgi:hypothetical protein
MYVLQLGAVCAAATQSSAQMEAAELAQSGSCKQWMSEANWGGCQCQLVMIAGVQCGRDFL